MKLSFVNRSTLDKRLRRIDKEISTVSSDIDVLRRRAKKQGVDENQHVAPGTTSAGTRTYSYRSSGPTASGSGMVREGSGPDRWQTGAGPAAAKEIVTAVLDRDSESDDAKARKGRLALRPQTSEQFATYFMTGGLEQQGTLRHERHVQRNKAIFMIFVLLLILFAVLFFIGH